MKIKLTLLILFTLSNFIIYSQSDEVKRKYRELELLEKFSKTLDADNAKELKCKNKILDVYSNLSKEIRKKSSKLTKEQYENIKEYQKDNWKNLISWKKELEQTVNFGIGI